MYVDSETDSDSDAEVAEHLLPFYGDDAVSTLNECSEVFTIERALEGVRLLHSLDLGAALEVSQKAFTTSHGRVSVHPSPPLKGTYPPCHSKVGRCADQVRNDDARSHCLWRQPGGNPFGLLCP